MTSLIFEKFADYVLKKEKIKIDYDLQKEALNWLQYAND